MYYQEALIRLINWSWVWLTYRSPVWLPAVGGEKAEDTATSVGADGQSSEGQKSATPKSSRKGKGEKDKSGGAVKPGSRMETVTHTHVTCTHLHKADTHIIILYTLVSHISHAHPHAHNHTLAFCWHALSTTPHHSFSVSPSVIISIIQWHLKRQIFS